MSPEDLAGYIHTQEEAIREFSVHPEKPLCALEPRLSFWEIFRDFFWGKGLRISQEKVERGDEPVDLDDISSPLPPLDIFEGTGNTDPEFKSGVQCQSPNSRPTRK